MPPAKLNPPFRADHVGSLLRPAALRQAFRDHTAGNISAEEFASKERPGFDKVDADGDGIVTKEEMDAMKSKMKDRRGGKHKRGDGPQPE